MFFFINLLCQPGAATEGGGNIGWLPTGQVWIDWLGQWRRTLTSSVAFPVPRSQVLPCTRCSGFCRNVQAEPFGAHNVSHQAMRDLNVHSKSFKTYCLYQAQVYRLCPSRPHVYSSVAHHDSHRCCSSLLLRSD